MAIYSGDSSCYFVMKKNVQPAIGVGDRCGIGRPRVSPVAIVVEALQASIDLLQFDFNSCW